MSDAFRLTFLLPQAMLLLVPEGRHQPCLVGCVLTVRQGLVAIEGPSRERVFDQARRFFRAHARKLPCLQVAAILETPATYCPSGRDSWSIVVNSDVTFTPTAMRCDVRPALRLVGDEAKLAS